MQEFNPDFTSLHPGYANNNLPLPLQPPHHVIALLEIAIAHVKGSPRRDLAFGMPGGVLSLLTSGRRNAG
jgi:hypothetical protein